MRLERQRRPRSWAEGAKRALDDAKTMSATRTRAQTFPRRRARFLASYLSLMGITL